LDKFTGRREPKKLTRYSRSYMKKGQPEKLLSFVEAISNEANLSSGFLGNAV
jgi:hypothetical protein